MFNAFFIAFIFCAVLTLIREYQRSGGITLLSLLTLGNIIYGGLTPAIAYYFQGNTVVFNSYVTAAGMLVEAPGLTRVMIAVMLFQLACLIVALGRTPKTFVCSSGRIENKTFVAAAMHVGWALFLIGLIGVVWLGLIYSSRPWGLYEIQYAERSPFFRAHSVQAFLLLLGMYGASQLVVIFLMVGRVRAAAFVLFVVTLHGLGIKSKFPLFWVLLIFVVTAVGERVNVRRLLLPIGFSALILMSMSVLRVVKNLTDFPGYIAMHYAEILRGSGAKVWENDIPGPSGITYFVINTSGPIQTLEPLFEIFRILIPRIIYNRGVVVSDFWAAKMMGERYQPGLGFGWSLVCDGYLIAGWLGVFLIAYGVARLARYIFQYRLKSKENNIFILVVIYTCASIFFYGVRESVGGFLKSLVIMASLLWLPTFFLAWMRIRSVAKGSREMSSLNLSTKVGEGSVDFGRKF